MQFPVGERVIYTHDDGARHRGRVTHVHRLHRDVLTDDGQRFRAYIKRLRYSPDRILILEGRLDRTLRSERAYGDMFRRWLSAYTYRNQTLYTSIHTLQDLQHFLRTEGAHIETRIIHLICHGTLKNGHAQIKLTTRQKYNLRDHSGLFRDLDGKILIFSCCDIGADAKTMKEIRRVSGAAAVVCYNENIYDNYTNLAEVLLYDRLLTTVQHPRDAVKKVQQLMKSAGTIACARRIRSSPIMVY